MWRCHDRECFHEKVVRHYLCIARMWERSPRGKLDVRYARVQKRERERERDGRREGGREGRKAHARERQDGAQSPHAWPAISDIWLGIRTVPVLSVAKESRGASQIAHWPRSARTQAGRCGLTDRRSSVKKL